MTSTTTSKITHMCIVGMVAVLAVTGSAATVYDEEDGGLFEIPGNGCIAIVDAVGGKLPVEVENAAQKMEHYIRVRFCRKTIANFSVSESPGKVMTETGAQAAVFIVDEPTLPISLLSIEANWGMVNLAALRVDGADDAVVASRAHKEFMRIAALAFGAWRCEMAGSLLGKATSAKDLDALSGRGMTLFELRNIMTHLLAIGVTRSQAFSYRELCTQGNAPAPTNDVQRAIWEKVKADKERGPSNPIKIEPPKK